MRNIMRTVYIIIMQVVRPTWIHIIGALIPNIGDIGSASSSSRGNGTDLPEECLFRRLSFHIGTYDL